MSSFYKVKVKNNSSLVFRHQAPTNIALIKYAGKKDSADNLPLNPSLSYTLKHLKSTVEICTLNPSDWKNKCSPPSYPPTVHRWEALKGKGFFPLKLSEKSIKRFLIFFEDLRVFFHLPARPFLIRSGNNFPSDSGVASSASSFCALTQATYKMALHLSAIASHREKKSLLPHQAEKQTSSQKSFSLSTGELSALSRKGSGSSARSFFQPWALWQDQQAGPAPVKGFSHLLHQLVICDPESKKAVSSSEAHQRVKNSPLFKGRVGRAKQRLSALILALNHKHWRKCFQITWEEFEDLHRMYESASPPVKYRTQSSEFVVQFIRDFWKQHNTGPLLTMDAGSCVHLLYQPVQKTMARDISLHLSSRFKIL